MDEEKKDLAIGAVGAVVLVVLVVVLFYVGEAAPSGDDGTGTGAGDGTDGGSPGDGATTFQPPPEYVNGTVDAGAAIGGEGGSEDSGTFEVPNGTIKLHVNFTFDTSQGGDLDCHLYDPNGTKHGDGDCHEGSADSPQTSSFSLEVDASQVGEWEAVAHTDKSSDTGLNQDTDYSFEIRMTVRE